MKPIAAALSVLLALALLAAPVPSPGHQEGKVYRMGYFGDGTPPAPGNTTPPPVPSKGWSYLAGIQGRVAGVRVSPGASLKP